MLEFTRLQETSPLRMVPKGNISFLNFLKGNLVFLFKVKFRLPLRDFPVRVTKIVIYSILLQLG